MNDPLGNFSPQTADWFRQAFPEGPTPTQVQAWPAIRSGGNALIISPTGSGKTLAAFLWAIDELVTRPRRSREPGVAVLYVSPMKALGTDVARNLQNPLDGIAERFARQGRKVPKVRTGIRTGDTDARGRRALAAHPPDILVTTPESLYLMLTSKTANTLKNVQTVIVDEIHVLAGNKRGAHLALSLERLDDLVGRPVQRIGLSATVRPPEQVARFLGGSRPVSLIQPKSSTAMDLRLIEPLKDMGDLAAPPGQSGQDGQDGDQRSGSIWPAVERAILDQVLSHHTTLVFVNSRGLAERLTARLNDLHQSDLQALNHDQPGLSHEKVESTGRAGQAREPAHYDSATGSTSDRTSGLSVDQPIAMAHHGSVSKERRRQVEDDLKAGRLRCVVATSSLELGIDMGSVDLVIQVNAPLSTASGLQRVGRADHQVGRVSQARLFPLTREQILECTASMESMVQGDIEPTIMPSSPLDVLAQQTVAAAAMGPLKEQDWLATVRRAAPFAHLDQQVYRAVLGMLSGAYTSQDFTAFRPILVWDHQAGTLTARPGAQRLAVTSGGTIPDRGSYSVVMPSEAAGGKPRRVGELDEEMVYESRKGDVITLGTTSWRIQQITRDRVVVVPAPGRSARLPFWHGEGTGRDPAFGRRLGKLARELSQGLIPAVQTASGRPGFTQAVCSRLLEDGLDYPAINNLAALLAEQQASTGQVPDDRHLVVERCPNEEGDLRLVLHSPYGRRVNEPWALAITARLSRERGYDGSVWAGEDGIVVQIPDTDAFLEDQRIFGFTPDQVEREVRRHLVGSALFQARFRQCAARSLYMPRMEPGRRVPLWQQRLRASRLLNAALKEDDFPLVLETMRECLQDVYDMPALRELMADLEQGSVRLVPASTKTPSPMASGLLFGYLGTFMYQYDMPKAERDAAMLAIDSDLLEQMVGQVDMADLLDQETVDQVTADLQRLSPRTRAKGVEGLADLLRILGPMDLAGIRRRMHGQEDEPATEAQVRVILEELKAQHRVVQIRLGARDCWVWAGQAGRLTAVLGPGIQPFVQSTKESDSEAFDQLVRQYAAVHGPFTTADLAGHLGLGSALLEDRLRSLVARELLMTGVFPRPDLSAYGEPGWEGGEPRRGWLDPEVFRRLRSRSLAKASKAASPVPGHVYSDFLLHRQGLALLGQEPLIGTEGLLEVVGQLEGLALPPALWESAIFPARVRDYGPALMDDLLASGKVVWVGSEQGEGPLGAMTFYLAEDLDKELPAHAAGSLPVTDEADKSSNSGNAGDLEETLLNVLADGGAYRFDRLLRACADRGRSDIDSTDSETPDQEALARSLWWLVRRGMVTNASLAPVRRLVRGSGPQTSGRTRRLPHGLRGRGRPLGRSALTRTAGSSALSAATEGFWTLVADERGAAGGASGTHKDDSSDELRGSSQDADRQRTVRLVHEEQAILDRYGLLAPVLSEVRSLPGGFSALYQVCRRMEEAGQLTRGVIVDGFGGAQFAPREVIDQLRGFQEDERANDDSEQRPPEPVVMDVTDPANLYGTALAWPTTSGDGSGRPIRRMGNLMVQNRGRALVYAAPKGHHLLVFGKPDRGLLEAAFAQLASWLRRGGQGRILFSDANGRPLTMREPVGMAMSVAGFTAGPGGMALY
ncbi:MULTISPECIES: ATP-dependent helicase [Bifidobacterium]|uniref:ATP-dependent helicase n=1 Tax=Bifidobacterium asteroides TaxID=1684 RepID=A0A556RBV5_9BIFI|nr:MULTISPECIES: ATP-dependent helicase [Bifidobacterium]MBI0086208.1 ATP-dependent helicase [Bifidobacterium sp. M0404]TSJ86356.1 ATP-dependent helicase [Bifidobacterium polysaccharolyticum]